MKTMYTLLLAFLILPATISLSAADKNDQYRSDKIRSERKAPSRNMKKGENTRKSTAFKQNKKDNGSKGNQKYAPGKNSDKYKPQNNGSGRNNVNNRADNNRNNNQDSRGNTNVDRNRNQNDRSNTNANRNGKQNDRSISNADRNRNQNDHRDNDLNRNRNRYYSPDYARQRDNRFRNDNERCRICFGIGYMLSHDRLHRQRCMTCRGRGFAIGFSHNLSEFCPVCFASIVIGGISHIRSLEEIARIETNNLSVLLDLTDHQANRIYRINLRYLNNRHGDVGYAMQERDKDILDVLNWRQQDIYLSYIRNMDTRDLCDNCYALR